MQVMCIEIQLPVFHSTSTQKTSQQTKSNHHVSIIVILMNHPVSFLTRLLEGDPLSMGMLDVGCVSFLQSYLGPRIKWNFSHMLSCVVASLHRQALVAHPYLHHGSHTTCLSFFSADFASDSTDSTTYNFVPLHTAKLNCYWGSSLLWWDSIPFYLYAILLIRDKRKKFMRATSSQ